MERATALAERRGLPASFRALDLYDRESVAVVAKRVPEEVTGPKSVYARFLVHSLEDEGRANLMRFAAVVLDDGGELLLEFRTGEDQGKPHIFGDAHFRVYLDPATVVEEVTEHGGSIVEQVTGHGLAVYRTEDPHVARMVARW